MRRLIPIPIMILVACAQAPGDVADDRVATAPLTAPASTIPVWRVCTPSQAPADLRLDPFYEKYCDAEGVPVVASGDVDDRAVQIATYIVTRVLGARPDVREAMLAEGLRAGVIDSEQVTTDMPEYRNLYEEFPGTDWDVVTRGLGATTYIPLMSSAEENLLCEPTDVFLNQSILVHEIADSMFTMGLPQVEPDFLDRLDAAYQAALAAGLWANTNAATNLEEYWSENVQSYFNTNLEADPPDGINNFVNTKTELAAYDPPLYRLIDEVFGGLDWTPPCP